MKLNLIITTFLIICFCSCNKKISEDNLKITLLNDSLIIHTNNETWDSINQINKHIESKFVEVNFKIENLSNYNYIFSPISKDLNKGNSPVGTFPESLRGLSLNNFNVREKSGKIIESELGVVFGGQDSCLINQNKKNHSFFKKTGYKLGEREIWIKKLAVKNMLIVPKHSTLYFESFISFPINSPTFHVTGLETIDLKVNKPYSAQMFFSANADMVKSMLTESLVKTVEKGEFKVFEGDIYSNSIPLELKFNDKNNVK